MFEATEAFAWLPCVDISNAHEIRVETEVQGAHGGCLSSPW